MGTGARDRRCRPCRVSRRETRDLRLPDAVTGRLPRLVKATVAGVGVATDPTFDVKPSAPIPRGNDGGRARGRQPDRPVRNSDSCGGSSDTVDQGSLL
jgi:hypothetical protein